MNFPANPTLNQTVSFNGRSWVWNGQAWDIQTSDPLSGYSGASTIITLGVITVGTWNADVLTPAYGGTGIASYTAGNFLSALDSVTLQQRTPAQVLGDIGAMPASSFGANNTWTGANTFSGTVTVSGTITDALTISSLNSATLTISADTANDSSKESMVPTIVMSQDGGLTMSHIGHDSANTFYLQPVFAGSQLDGVYRKSKTGTNYLMWDAGNDGANSGLDADLLDGQQGSYYLAASVYSAADVLAKLITVDGAGSGLDADTLDGINGGSFLRSDADNAYDMRLASGDGRGLQFWGSSSYKIFMSSTGNASYGARIAGETTSDYNLYFRMGQSSGTNRGFVFEHDYGTKLFAINPDAVRSNQPIIAPSFVGALTGNADTATKLATARTIDGVAFDGSGNILLPYAAGNIIKDGGFEAQLWNISGVAQASYTTDAYSGSNALAIVGGASTSIGIPNGRLYLIPGRTYRLAVNYKVTADFNGDTNNSKLRWGDQNAAPVVTIGYMTNATTWTYAYIDYVVPVPAAGATAYADITTTSNHTTGTLTIDNVSLTDITDAKALVATKLDTAVYTASDVLTKLKTVDGVGSGLDADLLDGLSSTDFLRSNVFSTMDVGNNAVPLTLKRSGATSEQLSLGFISTDGTTTYNNWLGFSNGELRVSSVSADLAANGTKIWHGGNDGAGSGLDADLLDGQDGSYYLSLANATSTLGVSHGGTGATTLTGLVKGNGVSAFTVAVAGTDYVAPSGSITGNAGTATKLATARTIGMSGVTATATSFDGSANIVIPVTAVPTSLLTGALAAAQVPAFTGDVTSTAGALGLTIASGAVTLAKMANLAAGTLLGNSTASAAAPQAIAIGSGLTLSGGVLSVSGGGSSPPFAMANGAILASWTGGGYITSGTGGATVEIGTSVTTGNMLALLNSAAAANWVCDVNGAVTQNGSLTVNCSLSTDTLTVNNPGSSPAGSSVAITSPGSTPGIVGINAGTSRNDILFANGSIQLAVSATTSGVSPQYTFDASGNLKATATVGVGASGVGTAVVTSGAAAYPGYLAFFTADGTRRGYIGWANPAKNSILLTTENGWNLEIDSVTTISTSGASQSLTLVDTNATYGVGIKMTGNGTTTPSKWIRVINGQYQIVNDAYNAVILTVDDAGWLSVGGRVSCGYDSGVTNSISCSQWFRSNGNTGWYNATYGGGLYMTDTTYVRTYNNKAMVASDFVISSDERQKAGIRPFEYNGRLNPIHFTSILTSKPSFGFSAQELQKQYPEAVPPADGNGFLTVSYSMLTAVLACQANRIEDNVEVLTDQVRALEEEVVSLKQQVTQLEQAQATMHEEVASLRSEVAQMRAMFLEMMRSK